MLSTNKTNETFNTNYNKPLRIWWFFSNLCKKSNEIVGSLAFDEEERNEPNQSEPEEKITGQNAKNKCKSM